MNLARGLLALLLTLGGLTQPTPGQDTLTQEVDQLKEQIQDLEEQHSQILKDLEEIKKALTAARPQAQPADPAKGKVTSVAGAPFKGDPNAKLTVIEFSDYQCPFCGRHVRQTLPQLETDYIETGLVKYVFRDLPLERIHKQAFRAAEAAECAGEQGEYWEMHDLLFANQNKLEEESLRSLGMEAQLDMAAFDQCMSENRFAEQIRGDLQAAVEAGATATPTFLIGRTDPDSQEITVLQSLRGAHPYSRFKAALDALLEE